MDIQKVFSGKPRVCVLTQVKLVSTKLLGANDCITHSVLQTHWGLNAWSQTKV